MRRLCWFQGCENCLKRYQRKWCNEHNTIAKRAEKKKEGEQ